MKRTLLSLLLCLSMVLTMLPAPAFAAEGKTGARASETGGLCEHHPKHDEACGYTEGAAEIPCSHEHTEECYSLITRCVHEHTAECYPAERVSENADGLSEAENTAPTECIHACTEKSGCILQTSDCKHEHGKDCGYAPATIGKPCTYVCELCNSKDSTTQKALSGEVSLTATQYTYTLHYDANGGSGAPPSQSVTSSEFNVWVPISEIIPTRDGYTFMGWANTRTGKPIYGGNGGYTECLVVHGSDMSTTIYAIWEVHNHSWGEWTSNGNGTHKRTCSLDSSHTETGSCSGGKATSTEKAICETCHTAYGEPLQLTKTVITTPPTLPLPGYVGNEYTDRALQGGEAKAENTGVVVPGSFSFRDYEGGRVHPGENRMVILFTPDDTEAYTTAECIITVMGTKRTITRVPDDVIITDKPLGTPFEALGLPLSPYGVKVETNTGASFSPIPVTWDGSNYNPNKYGEQIITGELHVERSSFTDDLEPTSTVKATARITLIDDRVFTPTLEPPTYSKQLYGGDLCFLVFSDKYLSGGTATANGETVSGKFTLDKDQKIYGHSLTASTLLQAGKLQLKVIFTPDNPKRYTSEECTVDVNVVPRTFVSSDIVHIPSKKIGTTFEALNLSMSFSFSAVSNETPSGELEGYSMDVVTSWDASTYDPNSFEEQTIYGEVNRAELEKYFTIPESADLRAVRKVRLEPDPAETEITQLPIFRWKNGDFTLPDNTIFTWRKLQMKPYNGEVGTLAGGMAKVKGTDTVAPGTFSFKKAPPFYLQTPGEHDVTVVFTPDDPRLHKPTETTIKINAIKNTIKDADEPNPITDKPLGTPFEQLGLPRNVCINAVDGAWCWVDVAWDKSSYDAQSPDWQTITGTLLLDEDANSIFQQPEPAVTAAIRVKLVAPPTITTDALPGGTIGAAYSQRLFANGTEPITWHVADGELPKGLNLNETTGEISGTPTAEETATFTVRALNSVGSDKKELSITIAKDAPAEYTITVKTDGGGTASASSTSATAGTEITLTAMPKEGYHFKEWQVESPAGLVITNDKFTMPDTNVAIKAIFEEDAPPAPTDPAKPSISVTGTYTYNGSVHTATVSGYDPATMDISGNTATDAGDYTVRVTSKTGKWADGSTEAVTAAWSIGKATQEAPNGLIGVAPTTKGGSDGKITGVTDKMEYRMPGETVYTPCTGSEITGLSAGTYDVRYRASKNLKAGDDAKVLVGKSEPPQPTEFTVTFDANGGRGSMEPETVEEGTSYLLPECAFTAPEGKEFDAWKIDGARYDVGDPYLINANTTATALWKDIDNNPGQLYSITILTSEGGSITASHTSAEADTQIFLTVAPNSGYLLEQCKAIEPRDLIVGPIDTNVYMFYMPESNVVLQPVFVKYQTTEFTVTFDANGGAPSVGSMTTTNQKLTSLPSASRSMHSFDGWYTDKSGGTKVTTDTVFSANTTVYAHWTYIGGGGGGYNPPVTYYTLRFETGGGSDIPSVRESYNTYIDLTKYVPTWRGHTFIGWYSERSLTNKVSGVYLTKDMTVYALWRVDENPGTGANPFTDVSEKDWFYSDVMFVYENGLMLGTSKTLFSPYGTATRGMMATILWRMEGSPAPKGKNSFTDVEAGKWYADAITWTAENGIFADYDKDRFKPDDPITREQLAAIFYRYADYKGYDLTVKGNLDKFKDADEITDYAKTAMQWAVGSDLVKGKSGNLLDPQGTATRAEIAAMLHRFIEKYELVQGKAPGGLMGWIDPKRLQIPKTGDNSVLGLWGFSLCTSLAGCLALTTWQTRRRREEEALQIIEK